MLGCLSASLLVNDDGDGCSTAMVASALEVHSSSSSASFLSFLISKCVETLVEQKGRVGLCFQAGSQEMGCQTLAEKTERISAAHDPTN